MRFLAVSSVFLAAVGGCARVEPPPQVVPPLDAGVPDAGPSLAGPTGATVEQGETSLDIRWQGVENATSYTVAVDGALSAEVSEPHFSLPYSADTIINTVPHAFALRARALGYPDSRAAYGTALEPRHAAAFRITTSAIEDGVLVDCWPAADLSFPVSVERATAETGPFSPPTCPACVPRPGAQGILDDSVAEGVTYWYRAKRASLPAVITSAPVSAVGPPGPPPAGALRGHGRGDFMLLDWDPVSGADSYQLHAECPNYDVNNLGSLQVSGSSTSFLAGPGVACTFQLFARRGHRLGTPSPAILVHTVPSPPAPFVPVALGGAVSIPLPQMPAALCPCTLTLRRTSYHFDDIVTATGLTPGGTFVDRRVGAHHSYSYWAIATNDAGDSQRSFGSAPVTFPLGEVDQVSASSTSPGLLPVHLVSGFQAAIEVTQLPLEASSRRQPARLFERPWIDSRPAGVGAAGLLLAPQPGDQAGDLGVVEDPEAHPRLRLRGRLGRLNEGVDIGCVGCARLHRDHEALL